MSKIIGIDLGNIKGARTTRRWWLFQRPVKEWWVMVPNGRP